MSLTGLRRAMLTNVPNIPRFGVTINAGDQKCSMAVIEFEGRRYQVAMFYVIHEGCGKRIRALFPREVYNGMRNNEDRAAAKPVLVFCPKCGAMVGKHVRRELRNQGRPYSFHNVHGNFSKNFIAANYIYPRGVDYDLQGEIMGVDREWVRSIDDDEDEEMVYDPDS
ncbi:hypothetical protein LCGC14_2087180 [marine sediment metagenome]|uniref:Uncharacterized protein n=1 Tax=marine sediment metagenome TaxID=412755 RepID=A0A0F9HAU2_9ZZZZ